MATPQNKTPETKRKRFRGQVTQEELSQFLARPASKIQNLDRNLRKSYEKGFFRHQQFDDIRELKKKLENNEEDSVQQVVNSDQSLFSLHNDKRTLRRRQRERHMKKTQEVKKQQGTTQGENSQKVQKKRPKRVRNQKKESKQPLKKQKQSESEKEDQSSENSEASDSSQSESSNSQASQSSSGKQSLSSQEEKKVQEQETVKEASQIKQQQVNKKNNLDQQNDDQNQESQNQTKNDFSRERQMGNSQEEQKASREEQLKQSTEQKMVQEKSREQDQAEKYLIKNTVEAAEKKSQAQAKTIHKKANPINQKVTRQQLQKEIQQEKSVNNNKRVKKEKQTPDSQKNNTNKASDKQKNQKVVTNRRRIKQIQQESNQTDKKFKQAQQKPEIATSVTKVKEQTKNETIIKVEISQQKNQAEKIIQNSKVPPKSETQSKPIEKQTKTEHRIPSRKYKTNEIYVVQPTKREHHLQYCPKVIVESFIFRNYYIIAPYLAVSQLTNPFPVSVNMSGTQPSDNRQLPVGSQLRKSRIKDEENIVRRKRIVQDFQEENEVKEDKQRQIGKKRPQNDPPMDAGTQNVVKTEQIPLKRLRTRRNR